MIKHAFVTSLIVKIETYAVFCIFIILLFKLVRTWEALILLAEKTSAT